jgi:ATP-dependent DNA ligase
MTLPIGSRAGERRGSKPRGNLPAGSVFLYAFDLIELDGGDLRREPLDTRKATLASLLKQGALDLRLNEWACCSEMRAPSDREH